MDRVVDHYLECVNITRTVKGKEIDCTNLFLRNDGVDNVTIRSYYGYDIEAGTYKARICLNIIDKTGEWGKLYTTTTFMVTRGKTQTTVKPSPVTVVNRDYARSATIYIAPKAVGVNPIKKVAVTGTYKDYMNIKQTGANEYSLSFNDGYVEKSQIKKIWQAITKFVTKTVTLDVYYYGSATPDKVNVKVKINP